MIYLHCDPELRSFFYIVAMKYVLCVDLLDGPQLHLNFFIYIKAFKYLMFGFNYSVVLKCVIFDLSTQGHSDMLYLVLSTCGPHIRHSI